MNIIGDIEEIKIQMKFLQRKDMILSFSKQIIPGWWWEKYRMIHIRDDWPIIFKTVEAIKNEEKVRNCIAKKNLMIHKD